jgi:GxxExxY protein
MELRTRNISFRRQVSIPVLYRGVDVGLHRLDFLIDDRLVVELKTVKRLDNIHFVIVRSYMRAAGCALGLLVNFANTTLDVKRIAGRSSSSH